MSVTRTFTIKDINPQELATVFCGMWAEEQAAFFAAITLITKDWPGAGWCQQSYEISRLLDKDGRDAISTLAGHAIGDEAPASPPAEVERLPLMRAAFRTTVSEPRGNGKNRYAMEFEFPDLDALHAADGEWRGFWERGEGGHDA